MENTIESKVDDLIFLIDKLALANDKNVKLSYSVELLAKIFKDKSNEEIDNLSVEDLLIIAFTIDKSLVKNYECIVPFLYGNNFVTINDEGALIDEPVTDKDRIKIKNFLDYCYKLKINTTQTIRSNKIRLVLPTVIPSPMLKGIRILKKTTEQVTSLGDILSKAKW